MQKRTLLNWLGLFGVISFLSYLSAVLFAPSAYPGYDWKSRAVSDLSAANAPSLALWNQLSCLYGVCGMICIMAVCVAVQGKSNKPLRIGIYLFAAMEWVSVIGFALFPLSESGADGKAFQDIMHVYVVTAAVVLLSITSLVFLMAGGYRKRRFISLAVIATAALALMFIGAVGVNAAPPEYFGIFQRFSNVISANGFNMALGLFLFAGKFDSIAEQ
jgi:hypothetical membrane protein